ncbi:hypothetical protein [Clostridium tagluense]|uniref:hypothetical protein n=1 Tax=Clostridium tagluense TaxID=360422 RepID=UPI001C0B0EF6|nr:hypothetical protein [Clostridium tagluense]MBU3129332.1 hypothetical protein [Clostridium tagluense]
MKDIGGYFGLEQLISNEYYKKIIALNNGRNALLYILKAKNIKKLYIPYYLCSSVSDMLRKNGYYFEYYNVDSEFMPIFNKTLDDNEYLYVVNYYGQLINKKVLHLKQQHMQIILDNTQAFFQKCIEGIDTIYNCRKFFGVSDGAYLSTDVEIKEELTVDISRERMAHILGRYEGMASEYYSYFQNNDESFKNEPLKYMSKLTHNILGAIDYESVRQIRNENYAYLEDKLGRLNRLILTMPNGAFAYPFYAENAIGIKKVMVQKNMYIPTLWPNVINDTSEDSVEHKYAANILPLPCDQRYGVEDMRYMIETLINYIG